MQRTEHAVRDTALDDHLTLQMHLLLPDPEKGLGETSLLREPT